MSENPAIPSPPAELPGAVAPPVLAEVVRSGFVEGRHRGSLVLLAADGSVEAALGDVAVPVFPRSANKPMQAAGVLRAGLELAGERLALAAASLPQLSASLEPGGPPWGRSSTGTSYGRCWRNRA